MHLKITHELEEMIKKLAAEQEVSLDDFARTAFERAIEDHMDYTSALESRKAVEAGGKTYSLKEMEKIFGLNNEDLAH